MALRLTRSDYFHLKPLAGDHHCREQRETVRGYCRAGSGGVSYPTVTLIIGGMSSGVLTITDNYIDFSKKGVFDRLVYADARG